MRILFLTSRFPYPAVKGDQLRSLKLIEQLAKHNEVDLLCTTESSVETADLLRLREMVSLVQVYRFGPLERYWQLLFSIFNWRPFEVQYFQSRAMARGVKRQMAQKRYDVVFCQMVRTAPYVNPSWGVPLVLDYQDAYSLNMYKRAQTEKGVVKVISWIEWKLLQRYERQLLSIFSATTIIAERDRHIIDTTGRIHVLPNGVDLPRVKKSKIAQRLIFSGNLRYFPNRDAASWLAKEIFPLVKKQCPHVTLDIVGATPPPDIMALAALPGVEVIPNVPEMWPYLARAEVAVVPMRSGSGMQNKVIEALAAKTAVVMTDHARAGLDKLPDNALVVRKAETKVMARAIIELLNDTSRQKTMVQAGYRAIKKCYSWEEAGRQLEIIMQTAIASD